MVQLLRCKVCGFIIKESKLGDKCPACGVPKTAFEPYKEKVSEKRKRILDLEIHPILTHFTVGFSVFSFILTLLTMIFPTFFRNEILNTIDILNVSLPIFVFLTLISGIFDGKIRFKRIITNQHVKKMIIGSVLLALAISIGVISFFLMTETILIPLLIISLFCVICAGLLGLIGKTLKCIAFPN
ncbi:MAG: rubredoxin-like domain-containing protein [Promethearchaeota archaeon]